MASMTIRGVDEGLKKRLRIQAAQHGCSMEEEAREILRSTLAVSQPTGAMMLDRIREIVEPLGGLDDLEIPPRELISDPPELA